jgi:preprotein translocase subunit SecG
LIYVFYAIHVIVCLFLILVVLLQQGKGADLSVFGGGSTQTAFGARGAATVLHKLTVICFVVFIVTTMSIAIIKAGPGGASLMGDIAEEQSEDATSPPDAEDLAEEAEAAAAGEAPTENETAVPAEAPLAPMPAPEDPAPEDGGGDVSTPAETEPDPAGEAAPAEPPANG